MTRWDRRLFDLPDENGFIVIFVPWYVSLALASDSFLTERNLFTVLQQASSVSLVAIGEMIVLLVSADMSEVLGLAHRVLAMCAGRVMAE